MGDDLTTVIGTDKTAASDAGHTTSEYALTKILVICGIVMAAGSEALVFVGDLAKLIPANAATPLHYVAIAGTVISLVSKVAYLVSRTLIKLKLADVDAAARAGVTIPIGDPAATVLGDDAPPPPEKKP